MAIIQCRNCGENISDKAVECPHCGAQQIETAVEMIQCVECGTSIPVNVESCPQCGCPVAQNEISHTANLKEKRTVFTKKRITAIAITVAIVVLAIVIVAAVSGQLSPEEEYAVRITDKLVNMMKDPDSFKLRNDILIIEYLSEDGDRTKYTYITYSANNSYGAALTSTAIFADGIYAGDMNDEAEDIEDLNERLDLLHAQLPLLEWNITGPNNENFASSALVDMVKVAKELKVDFVDFR